MIDIISLGNYCPFCSHPPIRLVVHYGSCPRIKSIEYFENGGIKKVEFREFINAGFPEFNFMYNIKPGDSIDFTEEEGSKYRTH